MHYRVVLQPEAEHEAAEARDYHDAARAGLGDRFLEDLDDCLKGLEMNPKRQRRKGRYRHAMLKRFPYRVVYEVQGSVVFIYQVRHASRRPSTRYGP